MGEVPPYSRLIHGQLSLGIVIALLSGGVGLSVFKKTPEDGEDDTEETSENNA